MGFLDNLPTLDEVNAKPRSCWKYDIEKRSDKNAKDDRQDKADERRWKRDIWKRDKHVCRCCARHVEKSLDLKPTRGECHHLAGRADKAVRWDVRNGILTCHDCHEAIEHNEKVVLQAARFAFIEDGKTYLNGDKKLTFKEKP